jgi:hypothetical protein
MSDTFKFKNILKDLIIENDSESGRKPPITTKVLLWYLFEVRRYDFESTPLERFEDNYDTIEDVLDKIKYVGLNLNSDDLKDFCYEFVILNYDRLLEKERDESVYEVPKYKKFRVNGSETYTARKSDYYTDTHDGYSKRGIEQMYYEGDIYIFDGQYQNDEVFDTWDSETEIDTAEVIKVYENYKRLSGLIK